MTKFSRQFSYISIAAMAACSLSSNAFAQGVTFKSGTGDAAMAAVPRAQMDPSAGNIPQALQRWRYLSRGGNYSFGEYASFLMTYPGWPGEKDMRRNAEQAIDATSWSPSQVVAFFDRMPPVTNTGRAKYAIALESGGRKDQAIEWGRKAWRGGPLSDSDESALLSIMGGKLSAADHDARIDALLWKGGTSAASRLLSMASPQKRPVFEARLAVRTGSSAAGSLVSAAGQAAMTDPGLLTDRATVLRRSGSGYSVRQMLASRPQLNGLPFDAEEWYETLLVNARGAEADGQYSLAYDIASKVDDGTSPQIDVSEENLGVRDDYTSLAWLAGTVAFERLGKYREAMGMFERYGNAARSPQTRSKGWYWAGRAAVRAGDNAAATAFYQKAAQYFDHFYGQLSLEALQRPMPAAVAKPPIADVNEAGNSAYMAARLAAQYGDHNEQTQFLRAIANNAKTEQDFANAIALSARLGRPDLSVMAGRNARVEGVDKFIAYAFPMIGVPQGHEHNWTLIHAITRQESQFDREAVSHAGARGYMQLMPGTARETAGKINLSYSRDALTSDTNYNVQLGSTYIQRMMDYYGGSYPLAIAAYNAGPGNVNKWIRANGDPRTGAVDIVTWIEKIPIFETKNYVQRVLENAVMYDLLNPQRAQFKGPNALSRYLGKNRPG